MKFMQTQKTLSPYPGALLNPKVDPIFKSLFTQNTEESKAALTAFLSAILRQPIIDVTIGQNELPVEADDDKKTIFDITCKNETEDKFLNIEMQGQNDSDSFDNRSEYHVAHLLNHFVKKGMDWDEVPEAFMISVLNFVYDRTVDDGFLEYTMRLEDGKRLKSTRMKIIYLELPKYENIPDMPVEKLTTVQKWAKFFLYANRKEKSEYLKILSESEAGIMEAYKSLDSISQNEAEWIRETAYWDAISNKKTTIGTAERRGKRQGLKEGIKKGIQQGIEQGQRLKAIETAKKLKQKEMPLETIAECVGLSVEEIDKL